MTYRLPNAHTYIDLSVLYISKSSCILVIPPISSGCLHDISSISLFPVVLIMPREYIVCQKTKFPLFIHKTVCMLSHAYIIDEIHARIYFRQTYPSYKILCLKFHNCFARVIIDSRFNCKACLYSGQFYLAMICTGQVRFARTI